MPIWKCPNCGKGVRGGDRPRKNSVVRYCLDCSAKEGVLVERVAPVLQKRREASAAKAKDKQAAKRAKEKQAKMVAGIDILAEARRCWNLPTMKEIHGGAKLPEIEFRRRRLGNYSTGRSWGWRIALTLPEDDPAGVYGAILHELVHSALRYAGRDFAHTDKFWRTLAQVARERWQVPVIIDAPNGWERQAQVESQIRSALAVVQ